MSDQNEFQKAVLSELGITSWHLADQSLLSPEMASSEMTSPEIVVTERPDMDVPDQDVGVPDQEVGVPDQDVETPTANKTTEQTSDVVKIPALDLSDKIVVPAEMLNMIPDWWLADLLLTLDLQQDSILLLTPDSPTINEQKAVLVVRAGESFEMQSNQITLPGNLSVPNVKKTLWQSLSALKKD